MTSMGMYSFHACWAIFFPLLLLSAWSSQATLGDAMRVIRSC